MRYIQFPMIIVLVASCGPKTSVDNGAADNVDFKDTSRVAVRIASETFRLQQGAATVDDPGMIQWRRYQDSLRKVILTNKKNKALTGSFLEEMYIRNAVSVVKDSLDVMIRFNLHGPDCGAPDCYSNDVRFRIAFADSLFFPDNVRFSEHEHGCVDKEVNISGAMKLVEQSEEYVIYHSVQYRKTLVLFSSYKDGTVAYYFTNVDMNTVNGKNVNRFEAGYDGEHIPPVYPFKSFTLTTNDYERFL